MSLLASISYCLVEQLINSENILSPNRGESLQIFFAFSLLSPDICSFGQHFDDIMIRGNFAYTDASTNQAIQCLLRFSKKSCWQSRKYFPKGSFEILRKLLLILLRKCLPHLRDNCEFNNLVGWKSMLYSDVLYTFQKILVEAFYTVPSGIFAD